MSSHLNKQEKAELSEKLFNNFKIPTWAGKPQMGLHLDVLKDGKLVQKLMIDEKKCYFFGRNRQLCDFPIDHESCSRVHAALVWHKAIARPFLIDLGSTHGTYIGNSRLELHKPQQVPIDSEIHFGASSRIHIIREKPQHRQRFLMDGGTGEGGMADGGDAGGGGGGGGFGSRDREGNYLGLPQTESELDNLTEFNTAQNRRIAAVVAASAAAAAAAAAAAQQDGGDAGDEIEALAGSRKRRRPVGRCVCFADEDDVINPEDVDPTVGRFRNLVYETFIPNSGKQARLISPDQQQQQQQQQQHQQQLQRNQLYHQQSRRPEDAPPGSAAAASAAASATSAASGAGGGGLPDSLAASALTLGAFSAAAKLGLSLPNLAPDVDLEPPPAPPSAPSAPSVVAATSAAVAAAAADEGAAEPTGPPGHRKKKYAKEAWPGKRPGFLVAQ